MNQSAPEDWHRGWTHAIGRQVRKIRTQREMSAQALSDRCSKLGYPVARNTVANLENGRKGTLTLGEIVVMAAALDTHPVQLLYPLVGVEQVEVLPGRPITPLEALHWFSAEYGLRWPGDTDDAPGGLLLDDRALKAGRHYFDVQRELTFATRRLEVMRRTSSTTDEDLAYMQDALNLATDRLRAAAAELDEFGTGVPGIAAWMGEQ